MEANDLGSQVGSGRLKERVGLSRRTRWGFGGQAQMAISLRSTSRRDRINTLRDEIAELYGLIERISTIRACQTLQTSDTPEIIGSLSEKVLKIRLLLNPNEVRENQLDSLISDLMVEELHPQVKRDPDRLRNLTGQIVKVSLEIFKAEWDRIKVGD